MSVSTYERKVGRLHGEQAHHAHLIVRVLAAPHVHDGFESPVHPTRLMIAHAIQPERMIAQLDAQEQRVCARTSVRVLACASLALWGLFGERACNWQWEDSTRPKGRQLHSKIMALPRKGYGHPAAMSMPMVDAATKSRNQM
jgi:hypothetical protein